MDRRRAYISPRELRSDDLEGRHLQLPERIAHYVRDVLRMEPGDALELFDGEGRLLECRLQSLREHVVQVAVLDDRRSRRNESPTRIELCAAIPKGDRWRWLLEKTTELGVSGVQPLETRRTVVDIADSKVADKRDRWRRIVGEAARQSERTHIPEVGSPASVDECLSDSRDQNSRDQLDLVLDARRETDGLEATLQRQSGDDAPEIRIWIGPEGGFTREELEHLHDSGAQICHLGPRILRSETAAVAATTLVQARVGDFRSDDQVNRSP